MQLLALGYKCIARQRIRVLAADQHADPADRRLDDAEADPVAICPDHLLEESRDDLAMVVEDCAVRVDEQVRVPEATHTRTGRSEELRVGKARVSTCSSRWLPYH